jgi:hypothetical protein
MQPDRPSPIIPYAGPRTPGRARVSGVRAAGYLMGFLPATYFLGIAALLLKVGWDGGVVRFAGLLPFAVFLGWLGATMVRVCVLGLRNRIDSIG